MPAILEFNGIRITVPTSELAEAITQLQQLSSAPNRSTTPLGRPPNNQAKQASTQSTTLFPLPFAGRITRKADDIYAAIAFLEMISLADLLGNKATPEAAMEVFHVQHAKGLGSKLAVVNRLIDSIGFAIPDIYITARDAHGSFWRPSQRIDDAIHALKEVVDQQAKTPNKRNQESSNTSTTSSKLFKEDDVQPQHNEKSP